MSSSLSNLLSRTFNLFAGSHVRALSASKCTVTKLTLDRNFHCSSPRSKAQLIDGKKISAEIKLEIKNDIQKWVADGNRSPHLTAVVIGNDPASATYIKNKMKAATTVGITTETIEHTSSMPEEELLTLIRKLNEDPKVDGILVQLPLPPHMNERLICNSVSPHKDVDGFHTMNVGRFCQDVDALIPCTPLGVMELIRRSGVETFGKNAVVCGRSKNVGMPIFMLLHSDGIGETNAADCTTVMCHRYTPPEELKRYCLTADILVVATGIPGLIKADMVKEGVCVIDVGINRIKCPDTGKQKLVGDVEFEGVSEKASYITPVPGGVGPMTVAMLMKNTFRAATKQIKY